MFNKVPFGLPYVTMNNERLSFLKRTFGFTFLHGAQQAVEMLGGVGEVSLHLHAVVGAEELRVLAFAHVVLVVELQVPHHQPVLLRLHGL